MEHPVRQPNAAGRSMRAALVPLVVASAISFVAGIAFSQAVGPSSSKGVVTKPLGSINLSAEIEALPGHQLRARVATIEPGGQIATHNHKGRPTMEYVLQGNVVEIRNGVEIPHGPGDMVVATNEVSHWWENRGAVPVILLPVDVFKP